jgi:dephospho-CoA kinase
VSQPNHKPLRVGLTGGIASGKSTVADIFAELGVPVIDTDVIAREIVQPGQPALDEIRRTFGDTVIGPDGNLDRPAMRAIVFADEAARHTLETILHPRIREAAVHQASGAGGDYQLIVVPLLVESPLRSFVDRVLVVDCDEQTQIDRLLARDAESEPQARRMIAAQASREDRLAIADDIINNDGNLQDTRDQALALHRNYQQRASKHKN